MKVLIISNCIWSSWDQKINLLKDWYKPIIDFDIKLIQSSFQNIPYQKDGLGHYQQVDRVWMENNIIPLSKGYDVVYFWMNNSDWKCLPVQALHAGEIKGIQMIEGGCSEIGQYDFLGKKYDGDLWFNIARHELAHVLYSKYKPGQFDPTHTYWTNGNIEQTLIDLKQTTMYKYFKSNEIVGLKPEFVSILDKARDIAQTPFKITSGYRTPEKNAQVGGVPNSSHTKGLACDLACTDNFKRTLILKGLYNCGTDLFIEICKSHIHIDIDSSIHKLGQTMWALDD